MEDAKRAAPSGAGGRTRKRAAAFFLIPLAAMLISLFVGRYPVSVVDTARALFSPFAPSQYADPRAATVILELRLPRILLGALVGAALSASGAAFQGVFRNPLVNSGILGVSSGAGFGAALAILLFKRGLGIYVLAFAFGSLAVLSSYLIGRVYKTTPTVMLVLGGVIVSSVFSSLLSFLKYVADPFNQLPAIVFWLMGSLAASDYEGILTAAFPMAIGILGLCAMSWRINVLSVAGPNGCGKTTLLDCVMGQARPSAGELLVNGRTPALWGPRRLATLLAYVPQVHERTFPYTVMEIVLMGRAARVGAFSSPSARDEDAARAAIARVGLSGFEGRPYTRLSGGECQLVMLARALAQEASLLVMDEPTAHLDLRNEMLFLGIASSLAGEKGVSILMATHDPNHAFYFENAGIGTRVALMREGSFSFEGSPSATLTEENIRSVYGILSKIVALGGELAATTRHLLPVGLAEGEALP